MTKIHYNRLATLRVFVFVVIDSPLCSFLFNLIFARVLRMLPSIVLHRFISVRVLFVIIVVVSFSPAVLLRLFSFDRTRRK